MGDSLFDQSGANQMKRKKNRRSIVKNNVLVKMGPNRNSTLHCNHNSFFFMGSYIQGGCLHFDFCLCGGLQDLPVVLIINSTVCSIYIHTQRKKHVLREIILQALLFFSFCFYPPADW